MAIKVFYSDQLGSPILNGTIGSLINVLDACLVNGYSQVAVATIIRFGSVVTVETVSPHGFTGPRDNYWSADGVGNIATIAGADQIEYNGEWPVTVVSPTSFTFDIGSATPSSPATGAVLTSRRSPSGFSKPFEGTNKACYRSNDPTSRRFYLHVNDTGDCANGKGGTFAWWRGYEKMSDVDYGEFPFPSFTQSGNQGQRIRKSSALDTGARRWTLISDGKAFFFQTHVDVGAASIGIGYVPIGMFFGDFMPIAPDPYAVCIDADTNAAADWNTTSSNAGVFMCSGQGSPNPGVGTGWTCIARRYNGQATPVWAAGKLGHGLGQQTLGQTAYLTYPDPFSNKLNVAQVKLFDAAVFRGLLPFYEGLSGTVHADREIVGNVSGREGRTFVYIRGTCSYNYYMGGLYIDITGEENGRWS